MGWNSCVWLIMKIRIVMMVFQILLGVHLFHYNTMLTDLHLIFMKFYVLYHMDGEKKKKGNSQI